MTNCVYSFFPEVQLNFDGNCCEINSPWMNTAVRLPQLVQSDYKEWANLLAYSLAGFPFVKISPAHLFRFNPKGSDKIINQVCNEVFKVADIRDEKLNWNHKYIAKESTIKGGFCTLSSFSLIQKEMFSKFPSSNSTKNISSIIATLQQSYYVTSHCNNSLIEGVVFHGSELEEYINSEKNHHHIIEKALKHLGVKPDFSQVHPATIACINLLKYSAQHHPFAFCCCLSFFEQGSFYETDPLADALIVMGENKAAEAVNIHFAINKREAHHMVGFNLVKKQRISLGDLFFGSIICETLILLACKLNEYLNDSNGL